MKVIFKCYVNKKPVRYKGIEIYKISMVIKKKSLKNTTCLKKMERQNHVHGLEDPVYKDFRSPQILLVNKLV